MLGRRGNPAKVVKEEVMKKEKVEIALVLIVVALLVVLGLDFVFWWDNYRQIEKLYHDLWWQKIALTDQEKIIEKLWAYQQGKILVSFSLSPDELLEIFPTKESEVSQARALFGESIEKYPSGEDKCPTALLPTNRCYLLNLWSRDLGTRSQGKVCFFEGMEGDKIHLELSLRDAKHYWGDTFGPD